MQKENKAELGKCHPSTMGEKQKQKKTHKKNCPRPIHDECRRIERELNWKDNIEVLKWKQTLISAVDCIALNSEIIWNLSN